jgi:hypothetical protein
MPKITPFEQYAQATFFSAPEVITRLQDAGFDIALIKQTLIPREETGTFRDGYGQGAFVGIQGIKHSIK